MNFPMHLPASLKEQHNSLAAENQPQINADRHRSKKPTASASCLFLLSGSVSICVYLWLILCVGVSPTQNLKS